MPAKREIIAQAVLSLGNYTSRVALRKLVEGLALILGCKLLELVAKFALKFGEGRVCDLRYPAQEFPIGDERG